MKLGSSVGSGLSMTAIVSGLGGGTSGLAVDVAISVSAFTRSGIAYIRFAVAHPAHFRAMELPGISKKIPGEVKRKVDAFYAEEERRMRAAQAQGMFAPLPFDNLILAATSLVHGLAHLIIQGETEVKRGDVDHAVRVARDVTAVLGAGLLPREPPRPKRRRR